MIDGSEVWNYFNKDPDGSDSNGYCKLCGGKRIKRKGNTSNLIKHLRVAHQVIIKTKNKKKKKKCASIFNQYSERMDEDFEIDEPEVS